MSKFDNLDDYEVSTLHSMISTLRRKLEVSEFDLGVSRIQNGKLKTNIDSLSAENGRMKRKLKRECNKAKS